MTQKKINLFVNSGSIKYLQSEQLKVGILDDMEKEEQFPICEREHAGTCNSDNENMNDSETEDLIPDSHDDSTSTQMYFLSFWFMQYISFWNNMSLSDFGLLMNSIIINQTMWAIEAIVITYYVLFIINRYNDKSIIYCTLMLSIFVLIFGLVNLFIPRLIKKVVPNHVWLMIFSSFLCIIVGIFGGLFTYHDINGIGIECYWLLSIFLAFVLGSTSILSEMCILELQPKEHIGKVTGMKDGIKMLFRGGGIVIVGLFWHSPYYEALWFGIAVCSIVSFVVSLAMWVIMKRSPK